MISNRGAAFTHIHCILYVVKTTREVKNQFLCEVHLPIFKHINHSFVCKNSIIPAFLAVHVSNKNVQKCELIQVKKTYPTYPNFYPYPKLLVSVLVKMFIGKRKWKAMHVF